MTKTSSILTFDSFFAFELCSLSVPGTNSDEYLNGKLLLTCCFDDDAVPLDCFVETSTRRMVSSLVVEEDDDDDVKDDNVDEFAD